MNPIYHNLEADNNGQDGILLDVRNFYDDTYLEAPGKTDGGVLPYLVPELLGVGISATLTIDDGVEMHFIDSRHWGYLSVSGHLAASGVTFRGRMRRRGVGRVSASCREQLPSCAIV